VDSTVALDNKTRVATIEVSDVFAYLVLSPELESKESPIPQQPPQESFCSRLIFPKFASESFLTRELKPTAIVSAFFH